MYSLRNNEPVDNTDLVVRRLVTMLALDYRGTATICQIGQLPTSFFAVDFPYSYVLKLKFCVYRISVIMPNYLCDQF